MNLINIEYQNFEILSKRLKYRIYYWTWNVTAFYFNISEWHSNNSKRCKIETKCEKKKKVFVKSFNNTNIISFPVYKNISYGICVNNFTNNTNSRLTPDFPKNQMYWFIVSKRLKLNWQLHSRSNFK